MNRVLIALMLLNLPALATADAPMQKVYDGMMSDKDLYAGEGQVALKSFGDDLLKAKASGRERARANMVEGIRVHVVSKTTDLQSQGKDGAKEEIKAESSSSADIELEGIQYKYLEGFPKEGLLTVLAYLSKEDYQRQSDKRLIGYRPVRALRIFGGTIAPDDLEKLTDYGTPTGQPFSGNFKNSQSQPALSLGADFYYGSWVGGIGLSTGNRSFYAWEPRLSLYTPRENAWSLISGKLGYEWTPWATRFQVVVPLQAEMGYLNWDPHFATAFGVAGGLRLRYWSTDRVAFDIGFLWHQGLNNSAVADRDGKPIEVGVPRKALNFSLTGPELTAGILWNGF